MAGSGRPEGTITQGADKKKPGMAGLDALRSVVAKMTRPSANSGPL